MMTMTKFTLNTLSAHSVGLIPDLRFAEEAPAGLMTRDMVIETVPGSRGLTLDGQPLSEIWSDLQARNAAFNATMDRVTGLFTFRVARATEKVAVPSNKGFEQATELGQPVKRRVQYVTRGFPLDHFDTAYGYTQEYLDSAVGSEIITIADEIEVDWTRHLMNIALVAIFTEDNATDQDGVTVKRLYNADTEVPPSWKRYTHDGTHTHYLTTGAATFGIEDIAAMETHLVHHGFDRGLFLFVSRTDMAEIRALAGFIPAVSADRPILVDGNIIGGDRPTSAFGLPVQGYLGLFAVVMEEEIPPGYLLGLATGGVLSPRNVVGIREHENPSVRGLRLVQGPRSDYPIYDAFYDGYAGAGVRQRGAAVVMQATAGAYATPTFA